MTTARRSVPVLLVLIIVVPGRAAGDGRREATLVAQLKLFSPLDPAPCR